MAFAVGLGWGQTKFTKNEDSNKTILPKEQFNWKSTALSQDMCLEMLFQDTAGLAEKNLYC